MIFRSLSIPIAVSALLLGLSGCAAYDRAAGTDTSGAYPRQADGMPGNPKGTAAERALDRAAGTDTSGAYPRQVDGMPGNPRGTAVERAYDRTLGTDTSGAYPQNQKR